MLSTSAGQARAVALALSNIALAAGVMAVGISALARLQILAAMRGDGASVMANLILTRPTADPPEGLERVTGQTWSQCWFRRR